jgi:Mg2+ and Co2+ transporter CorA
VSDKPPQNYLIHTVVLFVVLVAVMIWFLKRQWG